MRRTATAGVSLTALSLVGYVAAVVGTGYPGQSFTITGVIVGIALMAIGRSE